MNNIYATQKVVYRCIVCGREYYRQSEAMKECGSYELEPPIFKIGDQVTVHYANKKRKASVIGIRGPFVGDSFKNGRRRICVGAHVYKYLLKPVYKHSKVTMKDVDFWASDLTKI